MEITIKQLLWVYQQGGRTLWDIFIKDGELGVYMYNPQGERFSRIPLDERLTLHVKKMRTNKYILDKFRYFVSER